MPRSLLLYDADCGACTRAAAFLTRRGLRVAVAPLQAHDLAALGVDDHLAEREIPFVGADGGVCYGAAAVAAALGTGGPGWRAVSRILRAAPVRPVAAGIYRVVARYRHLLPGGSTACAACRAAAGKRPGHPPAGR